MGDSKENKFFTTEMGFDHKIKTSSMPSNIVGIKKSSLSSQSN